MPPSPRRYYFETLVQCISPFVQSDDDAPFHDEKGDQVELVEHTAPTMAVSNATRIEKTADLLDTVCAICKYI